MMDTEEIWKPIFLFGKQTYYEVSDKGRVRSLYAKKCRLRALHDNTMGYLCLNLKLNGKSYPRKVHRLVAEAFVENMNNLPEVNHINHNKRNNWSSNLEWVDEKENCKQAGEMGLLSRGARRLPPIRVGKFFGSICFREYPSLSKVVADGYPRISVTRALDSNKSYKGFYWRRVA